MKSSKWPILLLGVLVAAVSVVAAWLGEARRPSGVNTPPPATPTTHVEASPVEGRIAVPSKLPSGAETAPDEATPGSDPPVVSPDPTEVRIDTLEHQRTLFHEALAFGRKRQALHVLRSMMPLVYTAYLDDQNRAIPADQVPRINVHGQTVYDRGGYSTIVSGLRGVYFFDYEEFPEAPVLLNAIRPALDRLDRSVFEERTGVSAEEGEPAFDEIPAWALEEFEARIDQVLAKKVGAGT